MQKPNCTAHKHTKHTHTASKHTHIASKHTHEQTRNCLVLADWEGLPDLCECYQPCKVFSLGGVPFKIVSVVGGLASTSCMCLNHWSGFILSWHLTVSSRHSSKALTLQHLYHWAKSRISWRHHICKVFSFCMFFCATDYVSAPYTYIYTIPILLSLRSMNCTNRAASSGVQYMRQTCRSILSRFTKMWLHTKQGKGASGDHLVFVEIKAISMSGKYHS